jgi:hypothetical protein
MTPGNEPIYAGMPGAPVQPPQNPAPLNADATGGDLERRLQEMVEARLSQVEAKYQKQVAQLSEALKNAQRGAPATSVPFNAGGVGTEVAQVWGQYHQDLANKGELPEDMLHLVRGEVREEAA